MRYGRWPEKMIAAASHVASPISIAISSTTRGRATLPNARLRKRLPTYPLPVLRLARLGVDVRAQGLGIGKALLRHVLSLALEQRDRLGCVGVVTDAKPDAVAFYESLGFQALEGVREGLLISEPVPMFLGIETIAAALRS